MTANRIEGSRQDATPHVSRVNGHGDEAALDALLEQVEDDARAGRPVDLEALVRRHPGLASELRRTVPALLALEAKAARDATEDGRAGVPRAVLEGDRTLGDYRLLREIGRGGMGVVYEAEQVSLGRRVALKVLPLAGLLDERALQRFRNEARAAASLEHPHVVGVHGIGCDRGTHYLAMRLIDGPPLSEVIRRAWDEGGFGAGGAAASERRTPYGSDPDPLAATVVDGRGDPGSSNTAAEPVSRADHSAVSTELTARSKGRFRSAARLMRQAADALEYAHSLGVIHRDVKPSNLLLDSKADVWVADFGLAHLEGDAALTMTGDLMGTLRYMSPEQATGRRGLVDHRSDVYSLGLTLYELLTLRPAFPHEHRAELLQAVIFDEPSRPRKLDPRVPRDLETVVLKATEKDPARRYQSAKAFADDLERFLSGEHVLAKRPSIPEWASRWVWRHRLLTAAAGVALLLLTAGAGAESRRRSTAEATVLLAAREDLAAATAAFAAGDFALAQAELTEAESRGAAAGVPDDAERLRQEIDRFRRFMAKADEARSEWDEGMRHPALTALGMYGVLDRAEWRDALAETPLPRPQQEAVAMAAYDLLVLLADYKARGRDSEAARQALAYLERAASARAATQVFFSVRAKAHEILGEAAAADRDEALAAAAEPEIALDHYLPGRDALLDPKAAARHFRAALRLDPRHSPSLSFLAGAYTGDPADPEAAVIGQLGCAAVRPGHAQLYVNLASLHRRLGRPEEAAAEYRRAAETLRGQLATAPDDPWLWALLRTAQEQAGDHAAVRESYERHLTSRPRDLNLLRNAADFYLGCPDAHLRDLKRAAELARQAAAIARDQGPPQGDAWYLLWVDNQLYRAGEPDEAGLIRDAFERELAARPGSPNVLRNAALYFGLTAPDAHRDPRRAARLARGFADIGDRSFASLSGLFAEEVCLLLLLGDLDGARLVARAARDRFPPEPDAGTALQAAVILTLIPDAADPAEAVRLAEVATAAGRNNYALFVEGLARLRAGDEPAAAALFRESEAAATFGGQRLDGTLGLALAAALRGEHAASRDLLKTSGGGKLEDLRESVFGFFTLLPWLQERTVRVTAERLLDPVAAPRP